MESKTTQMRPQARTIELDKDVAEAAGIKAKQSLIDLRKAMAAAVSNGRHETYNALKAEMARQKVEFTLEEIRAAEAE